MKVSRALLVFLLYSLAACGETSSADDGPAQWRVSDQPSLTIGALSGDSTQLFQSIVGAFQTPNGQIVIADAGIPAVRVFSESAEFIQQFGRSGSGPGEFTSLAGVWLEQDSLVGVWDPRARRVSRFSLQGQLVEELSLTASEAGNLDMFVGRLSTGGLLLASVAFGPEGPLRTDQMTIYRIDEQGGVERITTVPGMVRSERAPLPFSPYPFFASVGDTWLYTNGASSSVQVAPGTPEADTLRFPTAGASAGDAMDYLVARLEAEGSMMLGFLDQAPAVEQVPELGGLLSDAAGRVWAKRYSMPEDAFWLNPGARYQGGTWWVSTLGGDLLAETQMPEGFHPLQIATDQVLGLSVDDLGVQRVQVRTLLDSQQAAW